MKLTAPWAIMDAVRKIIHVDMDAFYASVEQRDEPSLKNRPVVVGGKPGGRGVVAAASYEARKFGIRSAMSSNQAYRLCPEAVFLPPRFEQYRRVSQQIMEIFYRFTDLVEPLSLDEAYLDVTFNKLNIPYARDIAKEIKQIIFDETQLSASAGVAPNKLLAKIASDYKKPNGLTVIPPERVEEFLIDLPLRKLPGVGPVTEQRFADLGVLTCRHLRKLTLAELEKSFGKSGSWFFKVCRGEDNRVVCNDWQRQSLGAEDTFSADIGDVTSLEEQLENIAHKVSGRLKKRELLGRTITLKVTFSKFEKITRSRTISERTNEAENIYHIAKDLLTFTRAGPENPVRLLGIQVSNFNDLEPKSTRIFPLQMEFIFN